MPKQKMIVADSRKEGDKFVNHLRPQESAGGLKVVIHAADYITTKELEPFAEVEVSVTITEV